MEESAINSTKSKYYLAIMYATGHNNIAQDLAKARYWFAEAEKENDTAARFILKTGQPL